MGRLGIAAELLDKVVKEAKVYGCGTIYITASSFWESRQIGICGGDINGAEIGKFE